MRAVAVQLPNLIEAQAADITALRTANQQLRDEFARLKGGSEKPALKPSVKPAPHDHSSEAERRTRTPRGKPKKKETLIVTHEAISIRSVLLNWPRSWSRSLPSSSATTIC